MPREGGRAWSGPGSHSAHPGDSPLKPQRILLAFLLASTLLAFTPRATAQGCTGQEETFEDDANFLPPTGCWYTFTGGTAAVTPSIAFEGSKSLNIPSAQNPRFDFGALSLYVCNDATATTTTFSFRLDTLPTASPWTAGYNAAVQTNAVGSVPTNGPAAWMNILATGVVELRVDEDIIGESGVNGVPSVTVPDLVIAPDQWYTAELLIDCSGDPGFDYAALTITDEVTELQYGGSVSGHHIINGGTADTLVWDTFEKQNGDVNSWIDSLSITGFQSTEPGVIFCADPSLGTTENWGYDYKEDTSFEDDLGDTSTFIGLEDGFLFTGNSGDSAYLGKAFTPGTQAIRQVARLEADTELGDSLVRLAFTTGTATLSAGSTGDGAGDQTAAGDGQATGNFAENLQAVLIEDGDQWVVSIRYTDGGGLTQILGSANYGADPNSAHTFSFIVNTGSTTITGPLVDSQNHTIFTGSIAPGKAQLRGEAGTIIERDVPAGLASAEWKDSWVIAKGDTVVEARTVLDDNTDAGQTDDSTCIFDLLGTATVVGQSGSSPGSFIVVPDPEPPEDGGLFDPGNIDSPLFIGFLLVAGMIFTGARQGIIGMGLVGVFLLGIGLGFALGWIPLWLVLVMFVVSLAAVWFLPKPSGDGVS